jgi:hypothetical protein
MSGRTPETSETVDTMKKNIGGVASFIAMIFTLMPELISATVHGGDINLPVGHGADSHLDTGGGGGGVHH